MAHLKVTTHVQVQKAPKYNHIVAVKQSQCGIHSKVYALYSIEGKLLIHDGSFTCSLMFAHVTQHHGHRLCSGCKLQHGSETT